MLHVCVLVWDVGEGYTGSAGVGKGGRPTTKWVRVVGDTRIRKNYYFHNETFVSNVSSSTQQIKLEIDPLKIIK
jgi:hypothetical protein